MSGSPAQGVSGGGPQVCGEFRRGGRAAFRAVVESFDVPKRGELPAFVGVTGQGDGLHRVSGPGFRDRAFDNARDPSGPQVVVNDGDFHDVPAQG